jgi:protein-disulfide isomerase
MATLKNPVGVHDHVQGSNGAVITLVEYGDFECPYCGEAYPIVKQVQEHFGDRLRFVFRNFPLGELHPHAAAAAQTAEFAAANGKYWPMHDLLFENQKRMSDSLFVSLARELGLKPESLEDALREGTFEERVIGDFKSGVRSGVNGTPTFFINGQRHDDSYQFDVLVAALERAAEDGVEELRRNP